jgi:transcriptional regulator of heat shock response
MILIYKDIKVYLICCGDILNTELKLMSLKELFSKLQNDVKAFLSDTRNALERNNEVGFDDIKRVREHITERLNNGESVEDNEEILKVLNLFTMDKAFLQITSEETEGWVEFLNAIEERMNGLDKYATTKEERRDLEEINDAIAKAKSLLRK